MMAREPNLTEAAIRRLATAQSFERGRNYYHTGAVLDVVRRGDTLQAEVEGSQYEPYQVTVELDEAGLVNTYCSCPYDWGGICKHIIAVLLTYIHDPDEVAEREPPAELLEDLDREVLQDLLLGAIEMRPELIDWVESQVAAERAREEAVSATEGPRWRRTSLDPEAFRRQVRSVLHGRGRGYAPDPYAYAQAGVDELRDLLSQARDFIEAGDGDNALVILEALADELMGEEWLALTYDDSDAIFFFFDDLGEAFTEAILSADLSNAEREEWADRFTNWSGEVSDYGSEASFDAAIGAAVQGWEYEPLQRAMRGDFDERGAWEGEAPWYADDLAVARLNVLERQGRTEAYLNLAEAEGQTERYTTMLVELGRYEEAVEYGLQFLTMSDEAFALAQALREHDQSQAAMRVAQHGLTLEGYTRGTLAEWLRDFASGLDEGEVALEAAVAAFKARPSLPAYQAAENLASDDWSDVQEDLLNCIGGRAGNYFSAGSQVEVYLYEEMYEEAIRVADRYPSSYRIVEQVVDAVWEQRPEWAIQACKKQAEPIIEQGQSGRYHHAARWLEKAGKAARAAGELDEWRAYVKAKRDLHSRKYKLVPMLDELLEEF